MKTRSPDAYLDLVNGPPLAALTTVMPDGQPHSSLVWCDYDGGCARVNTTRQREKGRNMLTNPKVSLLVVALPFSQDRLGGTLNVRDL